MKYSLILYFWHFHTSVVNYTVFIVAFACGLQKAQNDAAW